MTTALASALGLIRIGIDPILIGSRDHGVHWYGVMYAVAFYVAFRFGARPYLLRRGIGAAASEQMVMWCILFGLLGARLYYDVQTDFGQKLRHPIELIAVWQGGMAFFGAIIGAYLALVVLAWRRRISWWILADAGALFAVVGQPIGRIGNVINGDILGGASTLPWATAYTNPNAVLQPGFQLCTTQSCVGYQPAAVYEALATLTILVLLYAIDRRRVRPGVLTITYLAAYAVSQLAIFQWREGLPTYAGLKQAQWTALAVLFLVVPLLLALWRRGIARGPAAPAPTAGSGPADRLPAEPLTADPVRSQAVPAEPV